ncbi:FecR family protein [Sphingobacterium sp. SYP-B4668]|uniref:FecR family protein n=1 Tax=Sphingobacterium sp. SYP-B4668 TaxID=2996035 RepID=UPI0022DCE707|nr:FecR family protein [Sphingobacterium sp. SYP-B4668]
MEEQFFKYQLVEYIHNRLDLQHFEAFFEHMVKVDPVQLEQWITEQFEDQENETVADQMSLPNLADIHKKVLKNIYALDPPQTNRIRKIAYWTWASCAAVVLCILSWLYVLHGSRYETNPSTLSWYENCHSYAVSTLLPDSSTAILYPNAKIGFESSKKGSRDVQHVSGKVIYQVYKNPKSPFQVHYKGYTTTALGTIFSVNPQANENVLIKLLEGKISVGPYQASKENLLYLNPNEEVLIDLRLHQMVKSSAHELMKNRFARADKKIVELIPDLLANVEWTNQTVSFNQTKNIELLQVIERLYDVSVFCENPELLNSSFTGSINRKEPLETFFTNFCQLNGCSFNLDNGIVHVKNVTRKEEPQ